MYGMQTWIETIRALNPLQRSRAHTRTSEEKSVCAQNNYN